MPNEEVGVPEQRRPRILFVACHLPFPAISGGRLRELELLKRLGRRFEVGLRVVSKTYDEDLANAHHLEDICHSVAVLPASPDPNRRAAFQVARHHSPDLKARLAEDLNTGSWDLVHVEGFYLMQNLPRNPPVPIVLGEQNIEFLLWKQRAIGATSAEDRRRHLAQYLVTMQAEMEAWERADHCIAVTDRDRELMLESHPHLLVDTVPDGCDHVATAGSAETGGGDGRTLAFIANFGYEPNVDAARFLCRELLPRIRAQIPNVRLMLVGNAPPAPLVKLARRQGAIVTGRVEDITPYIQRADVIVCPLRIGGGMKVKVLEALRAGKPLVTTSVGAQGLDLNGAAVVADHPGDFATAAVTLLTDSAMRNELGLAALRYARRLPTWDRAAEILGRCYTRLLGVDYDILPVLNVHRDSIPLPQTTSFPPLQEIQN
ncbi:MAG TPA: glycosyltransferase [Actinomycetota bacterium]|nr:glycosyltransferase [Actinomycetota bacterium]